MGVNIDEKIVSMRFDNNQFLNGVSQTIQAVAALKNSLSFAGVSQGLQDIGSSIKNWSFDPMIQGIDSLTMKFSFLDTLTMNIFNRLSNQLLDFTTRMGKMATGIEGMGDGFQKYGEKTKAVQTILTAVKDKGYDLEAVNDILDDMNWFTDETSYSFTEMTNTIGKFTSAGVDLKDAKNAVQGIALWAAESGQNAQTASRAMYQLSQAYGTGTIKLQDWMSIEQANMSTAKIQNQLIEEGGEAAKAAIAKYGGFRDSLRAGWLTTEKFTAVMQKYSEGISEANWENGKFTGGVTELSKAAFAAAQEARTWSDVVEALKDAVSTGWMHTWEYIFGNKDEASELFTNIANGLIEVSDYFTELRNTGLKTWYDLGGRTDLVNSLYSIWETLGRIANTTVEAIGNVINPTKTLEEKMKSLLGMTEEGDKIISDIKSIQNLMSSGLIPKDVGIERIEALEAKLDEIDNASGLFNITNKIKTFAEEMKKAFDPQEGSDYYENLSIGLTRSLEQMKKAYAYLKTPEEYVKQRVILEKALTHVDAGSDAAKRLQERIDKTKELEAKSREAARSISEMSDKIQAADKQAAQSRQAEANLEIISSIVSGFVSVIHTVWSAVTGFISAIVPLAKPIITIAQAVFQVLGAVGDFVTALMGVTNEGNRFYNIFSSIVEKILPPFTAICELLSEWLLKLRDGLAKVTDQVLSGEGPIADFVQKVRTNLNDAVSSITTFVESAKTKINEFIVMAQPTIEKAIEFIMNFAEKVRIGAEIVWRYLSKFFSDLFSGQITLQSVKEGFESFFKSFLDYAAPLGTALKSIWEVISGFAKSLVGVFVDVDPLEEGGFKILSIAEILERAGKLIGTVAGGLINGLVGIFSGIGESVKKINLRTLTKLIKGLAFSESVLSIAGFLRQLTSTLSEVKNVFGFVTGLFKPKEMVDIIGIFKSIGTAFLALAGSLFIVSLIPTEKLNPAIGAITTLLLEIIGTFALIAIIGQKTTNGYGYELNGIGDMFLRLAAAIVVIAFAIKMIGNIGVVELIKGLATVELIMFSLAAVGKWLTGVAEHNNGVSIGKLSIGAKKTGTEMMSGAGGFVMMAIAIRIVAGAIKSIGKLDEKQIEQGITGFVIIIGSLTAAETILSKFNVNGLNMIGIAFSMQMLGLALLEMAGVIAILGSLDTDVANNGLGSFVSTLTAIVVAMAALDHFVGGLNIIGISTGMILLGVAMGIFAAEIAVLGSLGIEKVMIGLFALAGALTILGVAGATMTPVLPTLIGLAVAITLFSAGILATSVGMSVFAGAFVLLAEAISKHAADMVKGLTTLAAGFISTMKIILTGIISSLPLITEAMAGLAAALISGFLLGIANSIEAIVDCGMKLVLAFLTGIDNNIEQIVVTGGMIIVHWLEGMNQMLPLIISAGFDLITNFISGIAYGIAENSQTIYDSLGLLIDSIKLFVLTGLYSLVEDIPFVGEEVKKKVDELQASINEKVAASDLSSSIPDIPGQVASTIESSSSKETLSYAGQSMVSTLMSGMTDGYGSSLVGQTGNTTVDTLVSGLTSSESNTAVTGAGVDLTDMFSKSIIDQKDLIKTSGGDIAQAGADGAGEYEDDFGDVGYNLAIGLSGGLSRSTSLQAVCDAARSLVRSAIDSANDEGKINSPSKETYETGKWLVLGAVEGIKGFSHVLESASGGMSDTVMQNMSTALTSIYDTNEKLSNAYSGIGDSSIWGDGLDQPIIRPILDLSDVEKGAGQLSSLFGSERINLSTTSLNARMLSLQNASDVGRAVTIQNLTVNGTENMDVNELSDAVIDKLNRQIASENSRWAY